MLLFAERPPRPRRIRLELDNDEPHRETGRTASHGNPSSNTLDDIHDITNSIANDNMCSTAVGDSTNSHPEGSSSVPKSTKKLRKRPSSTSKFRGVGR